MCSSDLTGWKWAPSLGAPTADGAHPNAIAVMFSTTYAQSAFEPVLLGRQQGAQQAVAWNPTADSPIVSSSRSLIRDTNTPAANTFMSVIGVSSGRYIYGARFWQAGTSKSSATRNWAILTGLDPAYLQVLSAGTYNQSTIGATAQFVTCLISTTPVWVPAGQLIALAVQTDNTTGYLAGLSAAAAGAHATGSAFLLAGTSATTSALSGDQSLSSTVTFTSHLFRMFAELI